MAKENFHQRTLQIISIPAGLPVELPPWSLPSNRHQRLRPCYPLAAETGYRKSSAHKCRRSSPGILRRTHHRRSPCTGPYSHLFPHHPSSCRPTHRIHDTGRPLCKTTQTGHAVFLKGANRRPPFPIRQRSHQCADADRVRYPEYIQYDYTLFVRPLAPVQDQRVSDLYCGDTLSAHDFHR